MHGGSQPYVAGRGFLGTAEPESAEPPEMSARQAWPDIHTALLADYQERRGAHERELAKFGRSEQRQSEWHTARRQAALGGGELGFKHFADKRPGELLGTPAYDRNWLQMKRPEVQRGIGPMGSDRVGKLVARKTAQQTLTNRSAELAAEGTVLAALPPGGDDAPDTPFTVEPSVLSGGPSSAYPRSGALPKGTQLLGRTGFDGSRVPGY